MHIRNGISPAMLIIDPGFIYMQLKFQNILLRKQKLLKTKIRNPWDFYTNLFPLVETYDLVEYFILFARVNLAHFYCSSIFNPDIYV